MAQISYKSTRSAENSVSSLEAIIRGIAEDGGLYVPSFLPCIDKPLNQLASMTYSELAFYIMKKFFSEFSDQELLCCIENAYDEKFDTEEIVPVVKKDDTYFLELFHGPTLAFKDMALSVLPHLMTSAAKKLNRSEEIVILTATSGDTGKAALEGFKDVENTKIIVFYPQNGVSQIQKRQMITQKGKNTYVYGINGNFDDAQTGVKEVFNDKELCMQLGKNNIILSSANSINIGRLVPQIVYYFYAYANLLKNKDIQIGEKINVVVPTGNFGNILAAYYAKKMNLPINRLICASNENNVLYDFIATGIYDKRRELKVTTSPSMDILISSNLERLLYDLSRNDAQLVSNMMQKLSSDGFYEIPVQMKGKLKDFYGGFCDEQETYKSIRDIYNRTGYVIDTHTAVAYSVYQKYKKDTSDDTKTVVVSTASPFKFTKSVCKALLLEVDNYNDFQLLYKLSQSAELKVPYTIKDLENKKIVHDNICNKTDIRSVVKNILKA